MDRQVRPRSILSAVVGVCTLAAAPALAQTQQDNVPISSIAVSPATLSMFVGGQHGVNASATLATSPVETRVLGGGGGPSFWSITFAPGLPVSVCNTGATIFTSQSVPVTATGDFSAVWSPGQPNTVAVAGTLAPALPAAAGSTFTATLQCVSEPVSGSLSATWSGTQFDGTYDFGGLSGQIAVVGVRWATSNPDVAVVNQFGQVTAVGEGEATITATYGSLCWQRTPGENLACRGEISGSALVQVASTGGGGGGGGEQECAVVRLELAAGSAVFPSVDVTIEDPLTGEVFGAFPFPIAVDLEAPQGQFRVRFTAPDGYTVSPAYVDLDITCGDAEVITLMIAEVVPPPTIETVIDQATAAGLQQSVGLLRSALSHAQAGRTSAACQQLAAYMNQVQAQAGKKVPAAQAAVLLATAADVRLSLGCG